MRPRRDGSAEDASLARGVDVGLSRVLTGWQGRLSWGLAWLSWAESFLSSFASFPGCVHS